MIFYRGGKVVARYSMADRIERMNLVGQDPAPGARVESGKTLRANSTKAGNIASKNIDVMRNALTRWLCAQDHRHGREN